jgi:hypothetical protein
MRSEPRPTPTAARGGLEGLASYVTGVIATFVAIGGLYLVNRLEATTAMAVVTAGLGTGRRLHASRWGVASYVIWLTVSGLLVVGIEALSRTV